MLPERNRQNRSKSQLAVNRLAWKRLAWYSKPQSRIPPVGHAMAMAMDPANSVLGRSIAQLMRQHVPNALSEATTPQAALVAPNATAGVTEIAKAQGAPTIRRTRNKPTVPCISPAWTWSRLILLLPTHCSKRIRGRNPLKTLVPPQLASR